MALRSPAYRDHFAAVLQKLKDEGRYRIFAVLERQVGRFPHARIQTPLGPKDVTLWSSNDYLGLSQHPRILQAMRETLEAWGAGAGGTRNISGTLALHTRLESELAAWHGKESALLFTSGYTANEGALSSLVKLLPGCAVFSDQQNHASMIAGITRNHCAKYIFAHNDLEDLERKLASVPADSFKIVACESVYSMDGTIAPLRAIGELAKRYGALTYLDEVHGIGLYGPTGAGVAQREGCADLFDLIVANFGKSFGLMGGYVVGETETVDAIRSHASSFIFTTALPPVLAAGALEGVRVLQESGALRIRLHRQASRLRAALLKAGLPVLPSGSHIVPLLIGGARCCKGVADALLERANIYVQPINFPTVAVGEERLRLTPTPFHTDAMIDDLVEALDTLWQEHQLPRRRFA